MAGKDSSMNEFIAANHTKMHGFTIAVSNLSAIAANGAIKVAGAKQVSSGANAVVLSAGKSKVVFSTRKIGSDSMEVDFEAEITLSESPGELVIEGPSGGKMTMYELLDLGYRLVDKTCVASNTKGKPIVESVTYYERHLASISLQIIDADGTLSEADEIQDDAYMLGGQIVSRDPVGLFAALGINGAEQWVDRYVLLHEPFVEVRKVVTEHCLLDHVHINDVEDAVMRCL